MVEIGGSERLEFNTDDNKASSQLNLANLILVDLVVLIRTSAIIESKLKYGSLAPAAFTQFYTSFRELFDLTSHLIDAKLSDRIEKWFEDVDVKDTKSLNEDVKTALKLSRRLKMEIVKLGLLKIFDQPIEPPFMIDDDFKMQYVVKGKLTDQDRIPIDVDKQDADNQKIIDDQAQKEKKRVMSIKKIRSGA